MSRRSGLIMLLALLFFALQSVASPFFAAGNQTGGLMPRSCMYDEQTKTWNCDGNLASLEEMVERMRNPDKGGRASDRNSVVFWSELGEMVTSPTGPGMWILLWATRAKVRWYWMSDATSNRGDPPGGWFRKNNAWAYSKASDPTYIQRYGGNTWEIFCNCWYQALATAAINPDAYVFTRKEVTSYHPESVWSRIELPYLTKNPNIQRIWRVDPRPPEAGGTSCGQLSERVLFWDRSRGDAEVEPKYSCPVRQAQAQPSAGGVAKRTAMPTTYRPY